MKHAEFFVKVPKEASISLYLFIIEPPGTLSLSQWTIKTLQDYTMYVGQGEMPIMLDHFIPANKHHCAAKGITKAFAEGLGVKCFQVFFTHYPYVANFLEMALCQSLKNPNMVNIITSNHYEVDRLFNSKEEEKCFLDEIALEALNVLKVQPGGYMYKRPG